MEPFMHVSELPEIVVVMITVVENQREILLDPQGTSVWSGQTVQSLNSSAVTWSLAKYLYSPKGPYVIVPAALAIGVIPTVIQWLISKVTYICLNFVPAIY